jgi:hypothetical protein
MQIRDSKTHNHKHVISESLSNFNNNNATNHSKPHTHHKQLQTDANPIALLKREFAQTMRRSKGKKHSVVLDLFSGTQGLGAKISNKGQPCMSFEIDNGSCYDLTRPDVVRLIEGWISSHAVSAVWMGTPCTSWSRARHGPPGSSWCAIRSNSHILGLPNLRENDKTKIRQGNLTMAVSTRFIRACIKHGVPCFLENPAHSMMWLAPQMQRVTRHPSHTSNITDFCQHGARWRKRTRVSAWNAVDNHRLSATCSGKKGFCSYTGKHHIILSGTDKQSGKLWTQLAQPYPTAFAGRSADWIIDSVNAIRSYNWTRLANDT